MANGKRFRKINSPHVAYFQNPEGVSTRPNTRGIEEGRDVQARYCEKLIPSALLQPRRDFRTSLGLDTPEDALPEGTSYYDLAQSALRRLGASRFMTEQNPVEVLVDREEITAPCAS